MDSYYIEIRNRVHGNSINEFLSKDNSVARAFRNRKREFLLYEDTTGVSNLERLWSSLTDVQRWEIDTLYEDLSEINKDRYKPQYNESVNYPLNDGCVFLIPLDDSYNELISIEGKDLFLEYTDSELFLDNSYKIISSDPLYVKSNTAKSKGGFSNITQLVENAVVWIYSKAADKIFNITPLISNLEITTSFNGGFFSISNISSLDIRPTASNSNTQIYYSSVIDFWKSQQDEAQDIQLNVGSYYHWFQQNDVVFISFERLDIEEKRSNDIFIDSKQIPNKIWDMIGLIDKVSMNHNADSNFIPINISGRDLSKLLVEDGSYFYPYAIMGQVDNFFLNNKQDNRFLKRLFGSGNYYAKFAYMFSSIKDSLGFIFNHLTNISVVDNELFSPYKQSIDWETGEVKDRTSKAYNITNADNNYLSEVEVRGIWNIVKLLVDDNISDRRVTNSGITKPDGSLMESIQSLCQDPFVEFFGDTYLDQYTFIARQPPFTPNAITEAIKECITISSDVQRSIYLEWETEYYSYYQLESSTSFLGNQTYGHLANLPTVYLPEYISTFGNHRKVIPTKYISYNALKGFGSKEEGDRFRNAVINDLIFLTETTSYLPFTQKGNIVIAGGDRRIKRGTWIYIQSIDSYAYVDDVSNRLRVSDGDIDRSTTVSFSRCMKSSYLKTRDLSFNAGLSDSQIKSSDYQIYSYFSIVDTSLIKKTLIDRFNGVQSVVDNYSMNSFVNEEQFNFFLKRRI